MLIAQYLIKTQNLLVFCFTLYNNVQNADYYVYIAICFVKCGSIGIL